MDARKYLALVVDLLPAVISVLAREGGERGEVGKGEELPGERGAGAGSEAGKEEEESHSKRASVEGLRSGSAIELVGKETPVRGGRASDAAANSEPESARGCSQEIFPALSACLWSPAMPPAAP